MPDTAEYFELQKTEDVTIVTITVSRIIKDQQVKDLGMQLCELVVKKNRRCSETISIWQHSSPLQLKQKH